MFGRRRLALRYSHSTASRMEPAVYSTSAGSAHSEIRNNNVLDIETVDTC